MDKLPTFAELTDRGVCPTCWNRAHDYILTGPDAPYTIHENGLFTCLLIREPRAPGHTVIVSREHYKDMPDAPEELVREIYAFAAKAMRALKEVYGAQSVYLCTMCDGPANHFHVQLIPRYAEENRGSQNFVKPRQPYRHDAQKLAQLREMLQ